MAGQSRAVPEVQKLRNAVVLMDGLSQGGFSEISSIAKLALFRLESPEGYRHLDDIATALLAISGKAETAQNCINAEAEGVDCNYVDKAQRRRWDAQRAHYNAAGNSEPTGADGSQS